jgi:hypothetical protein
MATQTDYRSAKDWWRKYFRWLQLDEDDVDGMVRPRNAAQYEALTLELGLEEGLPDPDQCLSVARQLVGCQDRMPKWLYQELRKHEGIGEESCTYDEAARDFIRQWEAEERALHRPERKLSHE